MSAEGKGKGKLGTCESFFAFESNLESNRPSDSISNRIFESNRPYIPRKP